uniref:HAD family phosphatase n=1 Tax=candidate division WOR-3 bacterium TaxID=2052148 RepID=A0A7C4YFM6_UNCW3
MLKIVIFDLDGTLVVNEKPFEEVRQKIAKAFNLNQEELKPLYEKLIELNNPDALRMLEEEEIRRAEESVPMPDLMSLIEFLRTRYIKLAILTRNCRKAVEKALRHYYGYFDIILTRDDGLELKPSPLPIYTILNTFGVSPRDAIIVGDFDYDIDAGRIAGIKTIRLGAGYADYNVLNIEELISLLKKILESEQEEYFEETQQES